MRTMHLVIIGIIIVGVIALLATGKVDASKVIFIGALALCPLMMIFMHGGHGGDEGGHKH